MDEEILGSLCTDHSSSRPDDIGAVKTGGEYVVGGVIAGRRVCVKGEDRGGLRVLEDDRVQA